MLKGKTMSNKLFTIAGTSNLNGKVKFRFATGTVKHRTLVLTRNEHTDIKLFELPTAMNKEDARSYVESQLLMTPQGVAVPAVEASCFAEDVIGSSEVETA
jgi:hypothetical protein